MRSLDISLTDANCQMPTNLFKFLAVMDDSVWGCVLAAMFVTGTLLWCFDKWSPYSCQNNMERFEDDDENRFFNLKESIWFCLTSLTPQGGGELAKSISCRMVIGAWWIFGFIVISCYTANLAAFLTVTRLDVPAKSLHDLERQFTVE